jgi:uncharacterized protein (DUF1697 family)
MKYVALLRGINVGGNNKINMKQLKVAFEEVGMSNVSTYINSGNVLFSDDTHTNQELVKLLEAAITKTFSLSIKVLVRDLDNIKAVAKALPDTWKNDDTMKCDIMFLWESVDNPEVLKQLTIKPEIDEVKYVAGTILWRVDRENVTKSGLMKLVGTTIYAHMTIRNCNTVRKLLELMQ